MSTPIITAVSFLTSQAPTKLKWQVYFFEIVMTCFQHAFNSIKGIDAFSVVRSICGTFCC